MLTHSHSLSLSMLSNIIIMYRMENCTTNGLNVTHILCERRRVTLVHQVRLDHRKHLPKMANAFPYACNAHSSLHCGHKRINKCAEMTFFYGNRAFHLQVHERNSAPKQNDYYYSIHITHTQTIYLPRRTSSVKCTPSELSQYIHVPIDWFTILCSWDMAWLWCVMEVNNEKERWNAVEMSAIGGSDSE